MSPVVLAFSGRILSGKTSLAQAVASALGCGIASFGDYVRSVARSRGLSNTREQLQSLGQSLVAEDVFGFCLKVIEEAQWESGKSLVIDGIRHIEALDCVRRIVAPDRLYLVFVAVDDATRLRRSDSVNVRASLEDIDQHPTEIQVGTVIRRQADYVVSGNADLNVVCSEIGAWISSL